MRATILNKRNRVFLNFICFVIFIALFIFGLWPFSFRSGNEVSYLPDRNGISFDGLGVAYSSEALSLRELFHYESIGIEMWIEPGIDDNRNEGHLKYAQLLTLYDTQEKTEVFSIGQWGSSIEVHTKKSGSKKQKKAIAYDIMKRGEAIFVTVTSNLFETRIFLNGRPVKTVSGVSLITKNGETTGKIILGNSATGKIPWQGKFFGLAVYNKPLTPDRIDQHYRDWMQFGLPGYLEGQRAFLLYRFEKSGQALLHKKGKNRNNLYIPKTFKPVQKVILISPVREFRLKFSYFKDIIINIAGFAPFGFFFFAFFYSERNRSRRSAFLATILLGAGISLTIELLQIYLPLRTSSLTDLICNITGMLLGIVLFRTVAIYKISSRYAR